MTDMHAYSAFEAMFSQLGDYVGEFDDRADITAEEVLSYFTEDGGIVKPILRDDEDFTVTHKPVTEFDTWDDPWPVTYGVDGSTTRALRFSNGLIAAGSAAKLGVAGQTDKSDLRRETTATLVAHLNDEEFDITGVDVATLDIPPLVDPEILQFPACDRKSRIDEYVVGVSRTHAEGKHARKMASEIDGPLFVDGPLYPNPVFGWMLFGQAGKGPRHMTEIWPEMVGEILQNYISTVEEMYYKDLPVIGITKTSGSSKALDALEAKAPDDVKSSITWASDNQLFSDALFTMDDKHGDNGPLISYTPWLRHMKQSAHGVEVTAFETYDHIDLDWGLGEEYQRAFFYARTPMTDTVMRIETPYAFVKDEESRNRIQTKVLSELAQQRKEPRAVTDADEQARITKEDRDRFRELISAATALESYNEKRGYRDLDG